MKKFLFLAAAIGVAGAVFLSSYSSIADMTAKGAAGIATPITPQSLPKAAPALKTSDPLPSNLFVELGKALNPTVVNISTSVIPRGRQYRDPMMEMLEQFYGRQPGPRNTEPGKPQRMGLGTGFIVRDDGLIITNAHVIQGADLIEVQLTENSKQYRAELIGLDERTDIALIKIKPDSKLSAAVLGSSDATEVGEWVAAFGNPFGHGHSMTKGIISSKGREIGEINRLPLLQTDASINPGNSGGPLVNSRGLVIGVNSAIDARAQGIGFAIPIDEVKKILPQLEQRGSIRKGYLGVGLGDIDAQSADQLGLDEYRGAVVMNVGEGPAKKAGVKIYDLITEVNGKKIRHSMDLMDVIAATEPGTRINLKIMRGEKNLNLPVQVGERPEERQLTKRIQEDNDSVAGKKAPHNLGVEMADLTGTLRKKFDVSDEVKSPIIVNVAPNSLANRIGLRPGDIVISVNKVEPRAAAEALGLIKKGSNTIRVARGKGMSVITFDIP